MHFHLSSYLRACYERFCEWLQTRQQYTQRGFTYVPYHFHGQQYGLMLPMHSKPPRLLQATANVEHVDITDDIMFVAGPNENFHGATVTPANLGYDSVTISIMDLKGYQPVTVTTFDRCEPIVI